MQVAGGVKKARKKQKMEGKKFALCGLLQKGISYQVQFEKTGWKNAKQGYNIVVGMFESAKAGCLARILSIEWISSL